MNTRSETSYRANKQVYLPKFESPKNPFGNLPKPPPPASAPARSNHIAAAQATRLPPPPPPTPSEHPTTWVSRLKASVLHDAPMPRPQEAQPAVQAELSLDSVKVLHNDLSDAEVEV
ncbi:MAG TPA: hypothetical protein VN625_03835, partial [Desulfuromonadaceae bacterium]|nr:hypothetical protein [Desulfuromonadaceae bacterium]